MIKDEEIREAYDKGYDAVVALIKDLFKGFELTVTVLEARIKQLESQVNQNSRNSSKPPSSDSFKRTKSQRKKSGKNSGAQKGHPGHTLEMVDHPDHVEVHRVTRCKDCGALLPEQAESFDRRQVFDMPPLKLEVIEHRAERKTCHICSALNEASFPEGVNHPAQYGPEIKSFAIYLNQYQLIPSERTVELLADLFGRSLSEGALFAANQACYEATESAEQAIKQQILNSPVIGCDETGVRVEGKNHWLHVACTPKLTCYSIHQKRGTDAMDAMGILPFYTGIAKHDSLHPYFKYDNCDHSLCNEHHLRELTAVIENEKQSWAQQMYDLLLEIKAAVDEQKEKSILRLELEQLIDFESRYSRIIALGYGENPFFEVWEPVPKSKKRGRPKKTKPRNLVERLDHHRRETLNFMYDFRIPFTNNQAERDIRMTKVQQKISGGFRSVQGARIFCRIRGYISTVKKNSVPVLGAIRDALLGNPFVPNCGEVQFN